MDEVLNYVEQLLDYIEANGSKLNAATQKELAVFLQEVMEFISEYQQSPADTLTPTQAPQLDQGPFPSSNVNAFKYNPKNEELFVKFHGADSADSGPIYRYQGIPRNIYDVFSRGGVAPKTSGQNRYHKWIKGVTPSLGASLYALIKQGAYPYQRIS